MDASLLCDWSFARAFSQPGLARGACRAALAAMRWSPCVSSAPTTADMRLKKAWLNRYRCRDRTGTGPVVGRSGKADGVADVTGV